MPNVSDFYLDHVTGKAYFEMDDGTNIFKDLSTIQDSQTGSETAFMQALIANGFVNSLSVDNSVAFQAAINEDWWSIHGTGGGTLAGQTNRTTATGFTATVASNTLSFNKLSGQAAAVVGRLRLLVPAEVGKQLALSFTANGSSASSAVKFNINYVTIPEITNNYLPSPKAVKSVCNNANADNMTVSTSDTNFNLHSFSSQSGNWDAGDRIVPPYATHVSITFDLTSIDASASTFSLNLKNFSVAFI